LSKAHLALSTQSAEVRAIRPQRWYEIFRGMPCRVEDVYNIERALEEWAKRNSKLDELFGGPKPERAMDLLAKVFLRYLAEPYQTDGAGLVRLDDLADEIGSLLAPLPSVNVSPLNDCP
jgi:hypothetical protein